MIKLLTVSIGYSDDIEDGMEKLEKKANKLAQKGYMPQGTVIIDNDEDYLTLLMVKPQTLKLQGN